MAISSYAPSLVPKIRHIELVPTSRNALQGTNPVFISHAPKSFCSYAITKRADLGEELRGDVESKHQQHVQSSPCRDSPKTSSHNICEQWIRSLDCEEALKGHVLALHRRYHPRPRSSSTVSSIGPVNNDKILNSSNPQQIRSLQSSISIEIAMRLSVATIFLTLVAAFGVVAAPLPNADMALSLPIAIPIPIPLLITIPAKKSTQPMYAHSQHDLDAPIPTCEYFRLLGDD
ncbi:MAG: hypothetical protein LQ350_006514 [Teloschistes chrysophthalmus]|nr:MAG: hypothetical protein LQ350_006514 [Niorma chrysophthalma]